MNLYEACIHTFGTVGTGGFSSKNTSVAAFNSTYIHVVITVFMMLAGINFNLYYALFKGKWKDIYKDEELRLYLGVIFTATVMICFDLFFRSYGKFGMSLRDAYFQVTSIMTTTGYATADFDQWSTFAKAILFVLMFMGGCAGSTAGGIKSIRILILFKLVKREIAKIFHPRAVISIKVGGNPVSDDTISAIMSFVLLYIIIFLLGTIIVSLEGIGLVSSLSSVAATLSNIGPGFEVIGPTQSYNEFSSISKWIFSLFMLLGRLEFFTIIALLAPKSWKNE